MLRRHSWLWTLVFKALDIALLLVSLCGLDYYSGAPSVDLVMAAAAAGVWLIIGRIFHLYASHRLVSIGDELKAIVSGEGVLYLVLAKVAQKGWIHPTDLLLSITLATTLIVVFHVCVRLALRHLRMAGRNQKRVLIYGSGRAGRQLAAQFVSHPWAGMRVVGFLDDSPWKRDTSITIHGRELPVLGDGSAARQLIVDLEVHELVVALPGGAHDQMVRFVHDIADLNVIVRIVPDLFDVISVRATLDDAWGVPLIGVRQPMIHGADALAKRIIDVALASVAIVAAAPVMAIVALLIKLDSKGPVLFRQERVGRNGQMFRMMKFRTMVVDAEQRLASLVDVNALTDPAFKLRHDPRLTRIGRLLRVASLDELPQLWNVLQGDMSLVGPRPEERRVVARYNYGQRQRLAVRPGITGPMQVNGRGDLPFDRRLALELEYIHNYSLLRDFELIVRTIPAVISGRGAY